LELHDLSRRPSRKLTTQPREPFVRALRLTPALLDEPPEGINVHVGTVPGTSDNAWPADYVRAVENSEIIIKLTPDEALVLSDWLEQVQMTDLRRLVSDAAVWTPLHRIAGTLDKSLRGSLQQTTPNIWKQPAAGFVQPRTSAAVTMKVRTYEGPLGDD
jgi:hypothetical protein